MTDVDDLVIRPFRDEDAVATSRLIGHTMLTTNVTTYPVDRLRELAEWFSTRRVLELNARPERTPGPAGGHVATSTRLA